MVQTMMARHRKLSHETATEVGRMLLLENYKSVYHRYDSGPKVELEEPYSYHPTRFKKDPVQVLKAISCLEYQSCEHPDWKNSEAKAFCEALKDRAIENLPGYDGAKWELG